VHPLLATCETVVFDLDGTLVESGIDFSRLRSAAVRLGADEGFAADELDGLDAMTAFYAVCEWLPAGQRDAFRNRVFEEFEAIEREFCGAAKARAGALELLTALREAGIEYGVATRNCGRVAREMLATAALPVPCVVAREDVGRVKPDPEHVWAVVDALAMPRRNICLVGDHVLDVQAGRRIHALTVGVLPRGAGRSRFDSCPPDIVVCELGELLG
jgi:phosphoglycolate phosphatase-like HAD superfamily hydrolase